MEKSDIKDRQALVKALGGTPAKYRVKRITKIGKDGSREVKSVCLEVSDIEEFRKKMKGRKFADVQLVYESIAD